MKVFFAIIIVLFCAACSKKTTITTKADANRTSSLKTQDKAKAAEPTKVVIKSAIAGTWYPADANQLKKQIDELFQKAESIPENDIIAIILPHAGYQYSGWTAATAIKSINRKFKRVIVIGPSHQFSIGDNFAVCEATHFETPLGQIPIDTEFVANLLKHSLFQNLPVVLQYEHSIQIQLPLLQGRFGDFKIVPIVAGQCSLDTIEKAASILKGLIDEDTLVIASSDFTHYGADYGYVPFKENIPEKLKELDMGAYKYIEAIDARGFLEYRQKTGATICGYVPISVLLSMLDKDTKASLLKYETSGQLTGDYTRSVSYLAVAFTGKWQKVVSEVEPPVVSKVEPKGQQVQPNETSTGLSEQDKTNLLKLARKTIVYYLQNNNIPQPDALGISVSEPMKNTQAAFVTLKKNKELRGCIGEILPNQSLYKSVMSNAVNAAVNDWRFRPVKIEECNDITIEISALTTPKPVASYKDIRIGTDGVILQKGGRSAVFLPQVAPEQGWGIEETLTNLSLKAGLSGDAWKEGAAFLVFQAEVFGEE
jgi:AmmeMemoRadiSam system protein B/AmmeMemoRadiSam system protein A